MVRISTAYISATRIGNLALGQAPSTRGEHDVGSIPFDTFVENIMQATLAYPSECAAHALALLTAADACLDSSKLKRLDELDAFVSLGVSRVRFIELAVACRAEIGEGLVGCSWLPAGHIVHIDEILDALSDPALRLRVCRLAMAAIEADGCVNDAERLLFEYMLARWHLTAPLPGADMNKPVQREMPGRSIAM